MQAQDDAFITTWEVTTDDLEIIIPTIGTTVGFNYNFTVDYGDGTVETNLTNDRAHTYNSPGIYTVTITGDFPRFFFTELSEDKAAMLKTIEQWGDFELVTMKYAFRGCINLEVNATDAPDLSQVDDMSFMFEDCTSLNQDINHWDVSNVTNMSYLFREASNFNQPLNNWDVSNVTNMSGMFSNADNFNQSLNDWDVSNVTNMISMFSNASNFNQSLNDWDVSSVSNMRRMFRSAESFNQSLDNWDVSNTLDMGGMFAYASSFNKTLNDWDVSNVTNMSGMFSNADSFNQSLNDWDVSNVTDMNSMFLGAEDYNKPVNNWEVAIVQDMEQMFMNTESFNQPLNNWNVSNVETMRGMFQNTINFNQPLSDWDVSNVQDMDEMFENSESFNQPINNWNVSNVETMTYMFKDTKSFDQPLNNWDISNVDSIAWMFKNTNMFNQPLDNWDVSSVIYMNGTFSDAEAFDQDLSNWTFSNNVVLNGFLSYSVLSTQNYDLLLNALDDSGLENISIGVRELFYCNKLAHQSLESKGWYFSGDFHLVNCNFTISEDAFATIWYVETDDLNITIPTQGSGYSYDIDFGDGNTLTNVSGNISHTYNQSGAYVVSISGDFPSINFGQFSENSNEPEKLRRIIQWGNNEWSSMQNAFNGCENLIMTANDVPNLSQVSDFSHMFEGCALLDENFNDWDVSNATDMQSMFKNAEKFNQALNDWDVSNVINMSSMFENAEDFNQPLDNWDVSSAMDVSLMFREAENFNQPLNNWDVSSVTDMSFMFMETENFNQPLTNWDVSGVIDMSEMFNQAISFNQDISTWEFNDTVLLGFSSLDNGFLSFSGLDVDNYNALLNQFVLLNLENKNLGAYELKYCNVIARDYLIDQKGWTIEGDELSEVCDFNQIVGNVYHDENNDDCSSSIISQGDFFINATSSSVDIITTSIGSEAYVLNLPEGDYEVGLINLPDYLEATPEITSISLSDAGNEVQLDFCISGNQTIEDLNVVLVPIGEARPGFEADYQLVIENVGTQSVDDVTLTLDFDDSMQTFVSANPNPDVVGNNQLTFQIPSLQIFETMTFDLTMQIFQPPIVNGGDFINLTANITPDTNDFTLTDNQYDLRQTVVNSFDPNDKQVLEGEQVLIENSDKFLHYLIRFQNTGTASAINVRIEDILHDKLDWNTIRPVSSSHNYRIEITDGNQVEFIFEEIFLPHEDADEAGSNGFVAYKIKPKSDVEIGDMVSGNAAIYFDYNPPIITNTVSTTFVEELSIVDYAMNQIQVYPNPTSRQLNINSTYNLQVENMTLFDIKGKTIKQIEGGQRQINMQNLEAGIYFLKIQTEHGESTQKIIKR